MVALQTLSVVLVGAGRYGMGLIGPKFATNYFSNATLKAVVDPYVPEENYHKSALSKFPLHRSADEWKASRKEAQDSPLVVDLALKPADLPEVVETYAKFGVKNMLLPKPVATTQEAFDKIKELNQKKHLKLGVVSHWATADITQKLKQAIENAKKSGLQVKKVEVKYNKTRDTMVGETPVYLCLSHALQLLQSTQLVDFSKAKPTLTSATPNGLDLEYTTGIDTADIVHIQNYYDKPFERRVEVYLDDDDDAPDIIADVGMLFERDGKTVKRPGQLLVDITKNGQTTKWEEAITEDSLGTCYTKLFEAYLKRPSNLQVQQDEATLQQLFEDTPGIQTFTKFEPIQNQLLEIQKQWKTKVASSNAG